MRASVSLEDWLHPLLGRYLEAPRWVRHSAGRAYRCLPARLRLGRAYGRFRAQLTDGGEAALARRLDATLRWALRTVPAYRHHRALAQVHRDPFEILARLPVTDKADIKRHPAGFLSRAMPASARLEVYTGGSTREPMRFFVQKHVTRAKEYAFMQDFRARVGAAPGDLVLALRGRTVPSANVPGGSIWMHEPIQHQLVLSSDHLEARFMPDYAAALALHRPKFIEAFPSALYPLARWLDAHPLPGFTDHVQGVMLYSENVYGFQMEAFRRVFGCPIVAHYGQSERVLMAATLPDDPRYFFWPQYGHLELVDARDRPVTEPGKLGFIVGTSFDNQVMPFVRYRTGDLGMYSAGGPHPALPGFAALERIEGRLQEFLVCWDLRLVSITTLGVGHFPELMALDAIQYEQERPGEVLLRVVAAAPLDAEARARIAAAVEAKTQGGCDVEVLQVERIARTPRGKAQLLLQRLDIRRYLDNPGRTRFQGEAAEEPGPSRVFAPGASS